MENNEQEQPVQEEAVVEAPVEQPVEETIQEPQETAEELRQRLENAAAENRRKAEKLKTLEEENERLRSSTPKTQAESVTEQLERMSDAELISYRNNGQYANLHVTIDQIMTDRNVEKALAKREARNVKFEAEIELEQKYPDSQNPSSELALKIKELVRLNRLENHPRGRLIAAHLASSELQAKKALLQGRKQEQVRQADVKANFQGDASRPAPKVSDKVKLEELKKKAMSGDPVAKEEWFKLNGLLNHKYR